MEARFSKAKVLEIFASRIQGKIIVVQGLAYKDLPIPLHY